MVGCHFMGQAKGSLPPQKEVELENSSGPAGTMILLNERVTVFEHGNRFLLLPSRLNFKNSFTLSVGFLDTLTLSHEEGNNPCKIGVQGITLNCIRC